MAKKDRFKPGTSLTDVVTSAWLNSVEERLDRIEKINVVAPLMMHKGAFNTIISFAGHIDQIEFVKLTENLEPYTIANANILSLGAFLSAASSDETDIPLDELSNGSIDVIDINGVTSLDNQVGIALKFKRSSEDVWVFIHWPLSQGDNLPKYDFTMKQALIHAASGYLEWMNINPCSSSGV